MLTSYLYTITFDCIKNYIKNVVLQSDISAGCLGVVVSIQFIEVAIPFISYTRIISYNSGIAFKYISKSWLILL